MNNELVLDVHEKPKSKIAWLFMSLQHVFAMFGATVLVPILTGLPVGVTLVASGIGTLTYIAFTKAKAPVFLGSSFAFIPAIIANTHIVDGVADYSAAYFGLMTVGIVYVVVGFIIQFVGSDWLRKLLPPVVIGPMIIIIGLVLAPVAISNAGLLASVEGVEFDYFTPLVAAFTFSVVVLVSIYGKGLLKIIPFLVAIVAGYLLAIPLGLVDFESFSNASFFIIPNFKIVGTYSANFSAVLVFAPIAFVTIAEHIGNHTVLGEVIGKDLIKDPGLDKTLFGDGVATFISAAIGGPANTTYGENTGVVAMTKVASVWVTGLAAIFAITLGFLGYVQSFILSIPGGVIGGITIVLYGLIAGNGVKVLVKERVNFSNMKNLVIAGAMLVVGLGGATIAVNANTELTGMSLAALIGVLLNLILNPSKDDIIE
jgi:uracil permease